MSNFDVQLLTKYIVPEKFENICQLNYIFKNILSFDFASSVL